MARRPYAIQDLWAQFFVYHKLRFLFVSLRPPHVLPHVPFYLPIIPLTIIIILKAGGSKPCKLTPYSRVGQTNHVFFAMGIESSAISKSKWCFPFS